MGEQPGNTTIIQGLLDRLVAGDDSAKEELIQHSMNRLRRLARTMLRENPAVRRWNETDDVLQNALVRLHRALESVSPEDTRRFVGLAATQIRRELIDLWRHHQGPLGDGKHHASDVGNAGNSDAAPLFEERDGRIDDPAENALVHDLVGRLPEELREVFEKRFYLSMTHDEVASELNVSSKTVKRRWRDAKIRLEELISSGD